MFNNFVYFFEMLSPGTVVADETVNAVTNWVGGAVDTAKNWASGAVDTVKGWFG